MPAALLDGKSLSQRMQRELSEEIAEFIENNAVAPCLAVILVGDDPASAVYVKKKRQACEQTGIESQLHRLPAATTQDEILKLVARLNKDEGVHGILVQLPLPPGIDTGRILQSIGPLKDVDCLHPENVGRLTQGRPRYRPCTPWGVVELLTRNGIETAGRHAVIVGRSEIVGKPLALMLLGRGGGGDATVTVCHSRTKDLPAVTRLAEILIVAIGRGRFVTAEMVRPGAVVVDVGISRTEAGLVGDVDFEPVREVASFITPVPGGVGPMTVTMLLYNTLAAARLQEIAG